MGSYLFYLIVRLYEHPGLKALGVISNRSGQCLVHECYPQLHLHNTKDYKMFYDAFAIGKDITRDTSQEALIGSGSKS